ncbi:hypothetical protein CLOM_g21651 [Closterium sp. NIES-68]|nr:hypothetical protein CLOM_g21651 [Closterium sp. NIES-68]
MAGDEAGRPACAPDDAVAADRASGNGRSEHGESLGRSEAGRGSPARSSENDGAANNGKGTGDDRVTSAGALERALESADVSRLCYAQRRALVECAVETVEQRNARMVEKIAARLHRVGLSFPLVEVRFEGVAVAASMYVGERAMPSLLNFARNLLAVPLRTLCLLPDMRTCFPILNGCSGILKPGRLTLLLGPPGAGAAAGTGRAAGLGARASRQCELQWACSQRVLPAAHSSARALEPEPHPRDDGAGDAGFRCVHAGTRREVERRERAVGIQPDPVMRQMMRAIALEGQRSSVLSDCIIHCPVRPLQILGLGVCAETVVGGPMRRDISGGQKKRFATGEALVSAKQVLLLDEISTGLDSSTTFLITQCLHHLTHTSLVALLQPAPETYELFDHVMLMCEGHIVFQGPREEVRPFFKAMGFKCPERKAEADFLQEVRWGGGRGRWDGEERKFKGQCGKCKQRRLCHQW